MTCTNVAAAGEPATEDPMPTARKAVLFCPECGYHAPVEGAWRVERVAGRRTVECPRCGTETA